MRAVALACSVAISGCAMSPKQFEAQRSRMDNTQVCEQARYAARASDEAYFQQAARELGRRGITKWDDCARLLAAQDEATQAALTGLLAIVVVAGAIAAARKGGSGSGSSSGGGSTTTDYDWDWDQFYNENGVLMWACRGVQTGQFADRSNCDTKPRTDARWPSLQAP